MFPLPRIKLRVRRRNGASGDSKNGMKRRHRIEPTVEPKCEFVEIGLQMFWFDTAMMCSLDPCLQIAEDEVDHRQVRFRLVEIASERQRFMAISHLGNPIVTVPSIGADGGTWCNIIFDKACERFGAPIWHDAKPQTPCIDPTFMRLTVILTRPNLDGANYDRFMMRATAFSTRLAANKAFINFDQMLAANGVTFWANHAGAELVEYLKGRLIASDGKLTLELNSGLARYLCGQKVRAPKPRRELRMARLHDGAAVSDVLALQTRQRNTTDERVAKRYGSPTRPHFGHAKPLGQRMASR